METVNGLSNGMFLTKTQLADLLRVTTRTIDTYMRRRLISFYKLGRSVRFKWADIEQDLQSLRVVGQVRTHDAAIN